MKTPPVVSGFVVSFLALGALPASGIVVASYNFDGSTSTEQRTSKDTDANSTASILSAGAGLGTEGGSTTAWVVSTTAGIGTPSRGNTLFASSAAISGNGTTPGTETASVEGNDYFEFTFTPDSTTWDLTALSLEFYTARTTSGTAQTSPVPEMTVFVRSSLDSYGATLGSATNVGLWGATGQSTADADFLPLAINLESLAAYEAITAPVTFRIYMMDNFSNSTNSGWGIRIDNIQLEGTLVPEPTSGSLLAAAGGAVLLRRSRRKGTGISPLLSDGSQPALLR